jgi:phosphatidylglycerophosphate synthase
VQVEKERFATASARRGYGLAHAYSRAARPLSWALWRLGLHPDAVSLLSLLCSAAGLVLASGWGLTWIAVGAGILLVQLGLLLDHADGQVARRRGGGTVWGMYLDAFFDRLIEVGIVAAALGLAWSPVEGPGWLVPPWAPLSGLPLALLAIATLGAVLLWRVLCASTDLLYLRTHILKRESIPAPRAADGGVRLVPTRDWVILAWSFGSLAMQPQATLVALGVLHLLACLAKALLFKRRIRDPEPDAARILGPDYH